MLKRLAAGDDSEYDSQLNFRGTVPLTLVRIISGEPPFWRPKSNPPERQSRIAAKLRL
jgi:hypothetical protein